MNDIKVFTIGFTKKSAETFFSYINKNNIKTLIDVRLNNSSQLSGFAKQNDLKFFLHELCATDYVHIPDLAPTKEILNPYKKGDMAWALYEEKFLTLMAQRNIEKHLSPNLLQDGCLLCSEHEPHHCHRRLVVEYLNQCGNFNLSVKHLF